MTLKLTRPEVLAIRQQYDLGHGVKQMAEAYGVSAIRSARLVIGGLTSGYSKGTHRPFPSRPGRPRLLSRKPVR